MNDKLPIFDLHKAAGASRAPDVGSDVTAELVTGSPSANGKSQPTAAMSVGDLVAGVKTALGRAFPQRVAVVGEISGLKNHTSGHVYFRLKDSRAAIDAMMFRSAAAKLKFTMSDGMEVVAEGRVDVYEARGQLQFYVERLSPRGSGALELAFQQMRQRLAAEGVFDPAHKVAPPRFPQAVGVITSPTGAAIRDIRRTLARRWPATEVYLLGVPVQGEGAAQQIAQAIGLMDAAAARYGIQTIILARGGGSIEDLWAFNEEVVARAIFACRTPVICGVGHEVDVTIADMVADVRAATPTAAAEIAVPSADEIRRGVHQLTARLEGRMRERLNSAGRSLDAILRSAFFRDPLGRVRSLCQRTDELSHRLSAGLHGKLSRGQRRLAGPENRLSALHPARLHERACAILERAIEKMRWALGARSKLAGDALAALHGRLGAANPRHAVELGAAKLAAMERQLVSMSYKSVLSRGYSVTRSADKRIVRSPSQVSPGELLVIEVADGEIKSVVRETAGGAVRPASPRPAAKPADGPGLFDVNT